MLLSIIVCIIFPFWISRCFQTVIPTVIQTGFNQFYGQNFPPFSNCHSNCQTVLRRISASILATSSCHLQMTPYFRIFVLLKVHQVLIILHMNLMYKTGFGLNWVQEVSGILVKIVTVLTISSMANPLPFLSMPRTSGANPRGLTGTFKHVIKCG